MRRGRTRLHGLQLLGDLPLTSLRCGRRAAARSIGFMPSGHGIRSVPTQQYQALSRPLSADSGTNMQQDSG